MMTSYSSVAGFYQGSPHLQGNEPNFSPTFITTKTAYSYDSYGSSSPYGRNSNVNSSSYPGDGNNGGYYGSSRNTPPSCLYASASSSPMCSSPCMLTPLSPYAQISPVGTMAHCKENYGGVVGGGAVLDSPTCRRRLNFSNAAPDVLHFSLEVPLAVAKRNERERNRVKLINMTFQRLRQHLPLMASTTGSKGKTRKLSKVQTLRSAIDYIRELQEKVQEREEQHLEVGHAHQRDQKDQVQQKQQGVDWRFSGHLEQTVPYGYNAEEDDDVFEEDDDDLFVGNDVMCQTFTSLSHRCDVTIQSNNDINNTIESKADSRNCQLNSSSSHSNDDNNNISSNTGVTGICPSILSFEDELKYMSGGYPPSSDINCA